MHCTCYTTLGGCKPFVRSGLTLCRYSRRILMAVCTQDRTSMANSTSLNICIPRPTLLASLSSSMSSSSSPYATMLTHSHHLLQQCLLPSDGVTSLEGISDDLYSIKWQYRIQVTLRNKKANMVPFNAFKSIHHVLFANFSLDS